MKPHTFRCVYPDCTEWAEEECSHNFTHKVCKEHYAGYWCKLCEFLHTSVFSIHLIPDMYPNFYCMIEGCYNTAEGLCCTDETHIVCSDHMGYDGFRCLSCEQNNEPIHAWGIRTGCSHPGCARTGSLYLCAVNPKHLICPEHLFDDDKCEECSKLPTPTKHSEICTTCSGHGKITHGYCKGEGVITCPSRNCHGGWVSCFKCGTSGYIESERIAGNIHFDKPGSDRPYALNSGRRPCPQCNEHDQGIKRGYIQHARCQGLGYITCGKCDGRGYHLCRDCKGRGWKI